MIHADLVTSDEWFFLSYGPDFAKLLGLAEHPRMGKSMIQLLPHRYRFLFLEGCAEAIASAALSVVRVNGTELAD